MGYETKVQIQLQVTDATAAALKEQDTNTRVTEVHTKRLTFPSPKSPDRTKDPCCQTKGSSCQTVALIKPDGDQAIGFISISASATPGYTFKKCGKECPGIFIKKTSAASDAGNGNQRNCAPADPCTTDDSWHPLRNALVLYGQAFHPLAGPNESFSVSVQVSDELFDCSKLDSPPVVVTITYGFMEKDAACPQSPHSNSDASCTQQGGTPQPAQTSGRRNGAFVPA